MNCIIYEINIDKYYYIGKSMAGNTTRKNEHLNALIANKHYNSFLQSVYNKYQEFHFTILESIPKNLITKKELSSLEINYIAQYKKDKGKQNIMNLTNGGEGMSGYVYSDELIETRRKWMFEHNPNRILTKEEVLDIYSMIKDYKTNGEIAKKYNLNSGYISCIRIGQKYDYLFKKYFDKPIMSPGNQKLSYEGFLKVLELKKEGSLNNKEIANIVGIERSSISRLWNKKNYMRYWERYENESNDYRKDT